MKKITIILILAISFTGNAQLKFAKVFTDHAVLQRQKPIPVWGWAAANQEVAVSLGSSTLIAKADENGKWMVQFPLMQAGGPYSLSVKSGANTIQLNDILIGDVWLLSGQSNMEWQVNVAKDYQKEKKDANYPKIRHFTVPKDVQLSPQTDLQSGDWKVSSEATVGEFSAVGFFFAREVFQKTNVPIGLLHSSWGGSQIEGWISKEGMLTSNELNSYAKNMPSNWLEADAFSDKKLRKQLFGNGSINPTLNDELKYTKPGYDFSKWKQNSPIGQWDWKGFWAFRGFGFMAKTIDIPASMVGMPTILGLGVQDSRNQIYINGKLVADTTILGIRKYNLPANTWTVGNNQLVVKFGNLVELPWYGLGLNGSAKDLFVSSTTDRIDISENWSLMPSFADKHEYMHGANNVGASIYNGMIAPLVPFALKGALWYQGEANTDRAYQYRHSFPLMINDWRKKWADDFSFYWVQLSSYGSYQNSNEGSIWAELREAQTMTLSLPKTGMAVSVDIGDPIDIHPTNKQDVGKRLAATALKQDFGMDLMPAGPIFESVAYKKGKAIISFKNANNGLIVKDKFGYLKGFEIAEKNKVFEYTKAEIIGDQVVITYPKKRKIASIRYAWADAPYDVNLYNKEGFPACPFRTDDWDGLTKGKKFE
jgi:sialate O-acetylesterase